MTKSVQATIANWLLRPTPSLAVRHVSSSATVIGTTRGRSRSENQDRAVAVTIEDEDQRLHSKAYIVCDGLGGMSEGERCAALAVSHFVMHLVSTNKIGDPSRRLLLAVDHTSRQLCQEFQERGGTTLCAVLFTHVGISAVSVGDSRIYRHGENGELTQLTIDDTIAGRLSELTSSSASEVAAGPFGHHLAQFIGQREPVVAKALPASILLNGAFTSNRHGSRVGLLITTDGVHRMPKQTLEALTRHSGSARELVHRLISVSDWTGGTDNATAMYISAQDVQLAAAARKGLSPDLEIHDAHGELHIAFAPRSDEVRLAPRPEYAPPIVRTGPPVKPKPERRKIRPKNKRKGKQASARRNRAAESDLSVSQPELDIKFTR